MKLVFSCPAAILLQNRLRIRRPRAKDRAAASGGDCPTGSIHAFAYRVRERQVHSGASMWSHQVATSSLFWTCTIYPLPFSPIHCVVFVKFVASETR